MTDDDLIESIREAAGYALHREAARRVLDVVRPTGWRVVPEKPSREMIDAGAKLLFGVCSTRFAGTVADDVIEAAIAAAPPPPLPKTRDDDPLRESFA